MRPFKRRDFLNTLYAIPLFGFLAGCSGKKKDVVPKPATVLKKDPQALELSKAMSKEQVHAMLKKRAEMIMEKSHNCAQSTFYVLSEQFGLGGDDILKALTPLPGMAERGDTCGAMTGALMAMGLIYGRERLDDWDAYRASLIPTNKFCEEFKEKMGSTLCCQIQERAFGRSYNLMDPEDLKAFQRAGATARCTKVVQNACVIASDIILQTKDHS